MNYGAYMTEIFRAGIQSVSGGQTEAAEALGMSYRAAHAAGDPASGHPSDHPTDWQRVHRDDQGHRAGQLSRRHDRAGRGLPASAAWSAKRDFKNLEALLARRAIYWALTGILTFFQARLERRLGKGYDRSVPVDARTVGSAAAEAPARSST